MFPLVIGLLRSLRFARQWSRSSIEVAVDELKLDSETGPLPTSRFRPEQGSRSAGWVLLHGVAPQGRRHPSLVHLARCLAASGATVLVPEVREWSALELAPHRTADVIVPSVAALEADPQVETRPGLMGFSFGGAQALQVAARPELAGRLSCVTSIGGYHELESGLEFLFRGAFESEGERIELTPDSYGLWIMAINYLRGIPKYEHAGPMLDVLRELSVFACEHMLETWSPRMRSEVQAGRAKVPAELLSLYDLFAPAHPHPPMLDALETSTWARELAQVALARDPLLKFPAELELDVPVFLLHGREDTLSPHTQTSSMAEHIAAPELCVLVTGLIAHSQRASWPARPLREASRLAVLAGRILAQR